MNIQIPQSAIQPFGVTGFPTLIVSPGFNHLLQHAFDQINEGSHVRFPADTPLRAPRFVEKIKQYLQYMGATDIRVSSHQLQGGMRYAISYKAFNVTHLFGEIIWLHPKR